MNRKVLFRAVYKSHVRLGYETIQVYAAKYQQWPHKSRSESRCLTSACQIIAVETTVMPELQSFHRSYSDMNNGVCFVFFCCSRGYQSAMPAPVHPLMHRLLQTLNYWVPPAAHLSRQANSFISLYAAEVCIARLWARKKNKKRKNERRG